MYCTAQSKMIPFSIAAIKTKIKVENQMSKYNDRQKRHTYDKA